MTMNMTEETKTTELFECSQDMEVFLHGFFSGEVDLDKSLMKELSKLSTFLFEERRIYAESIAKDRAVEFHFNQLYGDLISSGNLQITQKEIESKKDHIRDLYDVEIAFDKIGGTFLAEKRKEGAE